MARKVRYDPVTGAEIPDVAPPAPESWEAAVFDGQVTFMVPPLGGVTDDDDGDTTTASEHTWTVEELAARFVDLVGLVQAMHRSFSLAEDDCCTERKDLLARADSLYHALGEWGIDDGGL